MMGRVPNSALITPSLLTIVIIIAVGHDDDGDDDDDGNDDDYDDDDDGDALCTGWDGGLASPIMKTGLRAQQGAYPPILYTRSLFFWLFMQFQSIVDHSSRVHTTRNKMRVATESGKGMKVKVVKLC